MFKKMLAAALVILALANSTAWAESKRVTLSGDGPFSISKGDEAWVVEKNFDNAVIKAKFNDPAGIVTTVYDAPASPKAKFSSISVLLRSRRAGTVEIKFITESPLPNVPLKTRTVRVTVQ